jgi:NAD(P)-dependent dehydrogenase (short-subunit alcohol dehydrogenase family)
MESSDFGFFLYFLLGIQMARRLEGKVAIITGATSDIGAAAARCFVAEGARVILAGRDAEKGEALARELGETTQFKSADLTREEDIAALVDAAERRFGRLDCMFNNAGGPAGADLDTVTDEQFGYAMKLLVGSALFGTKHAARVMRRQRGGCIINNSSVAAHRHSQGSLLYSAAKASVSHLTRVAGVQLGAHGIRVNSISPGAISTPDLWSGNDRLHDEDTASRIARFQLNLAHASPLPRSGQPEDIAYAALFLASDEGSFVNCHDFVVDGGRIWQYHERPRDAAY